MTTMETAVRPATLAGADHGETLRVLPDPNRAEVEVTVVDPLAGNHWDTQIRGHRDATVFHTSSWARVLTRTYGHQPSYLQLHQGDETVALLPLMEVSSWLTGRRGVCLPFSDECPPLIFSELKVPLIAGKLKEFAAARKWKWCELRGGLGATVAHGRKVAEQEPTFYGHELDLTGGIELLRKGCDDAVHRGVRRAEKHGLRAEVEISLGAMKEFYRLHCLTRQRHGAPPQPWRFFLHIFEEIIAAGLGFIVTVQRGGSYLAGAVFFCRGDRALYKYGASEKEAQSYRPNNLCFWRALEHLTHLGYHTLQFGRTAPANHGLRRFKRGWGAAEYPIIYHRLSSAPAPSHPAGPSRNHRSAEELFRHLPLTLNRLAGSVLYPHLD
ncbi:hypothetical protein BH20VER1_BH20VER1_11000 [soil metagenome]